MKLKHIFLITSSQAEMKLKFFILQKITETKSQTA